MSIEDQSLLTRYTKPHAAFGFHIPKMKIYPSQIHQTSSATTKISEARPWENV